MGEQAPLIYDLELVSISDDRLDRGDYDDLTLEDLEREAQEAREAAAREQEAAERREEFGRGVV